MRHSIYYYIYIYVAVVLTDVKVHFLFVWTRRLNYNLESGWGHTTAAAAATTTLGWGRTTAAAAAITLVLVAGTIYCVLQHKRGEGLAPARFEYNRAKKGRSRHKSVHQNMRTHVGRKDAACC